MTLEPSAGRSRIGGRRPRMSESQTRELALRTAVVGVQENGLTVSLGQISIEDVIREAGVSRTTFYRIWPEKEQFVGDLIVELAREAIPAENTEGVDASQLVRTVLLPHVQRFSDPNVRQQVAANLITMASTSASVRAPLPTKRWRTYFALTAFVANLPEGDVRRAAEREIGRSESQYRDRLVGNFHLLLTVLGFRLRDGSAVSLAGVADLVIAMVRGLVLREQTATPLIDDGLLAAGVAAVFEHCFETDPEINWDSEHSERLERWLNGGDDLFQQGPSPS